MIKFADPMFGEQEEQALVEVAKQKQLTNGPKNKEFADRFLEYINGDEHGYSCMTVSSCTAALHLSYLALGLKPGDEVIVPAMTHVSTAHAVELVGATPIFIDCDTTGNIRPEDVELAITRKTKAVSVVHFLGEPVKMFQVIEIAKNYGLAVIEDCALALGSFISTNRHVGTVGDFAAFSFYPCKHITTGEGGMLVYKTKYRGKLNRLREFGKCSDPITCYDVLDLGLNYRMNEFAAAVGCIQLQRFENESWNEIRNTNRNLLKQKIIENNFDSGFQPSIRMLNNYGNYAFSIMFDSNIVRDEYRRKFVDAGIQTSIYYPRPVPFFTYYAKKYGCQPIKYKQAKRISDLSITLPIGPHITEKEIDKMVDVLKKEKTS